MLTRTLPSDSEMARAFQVRDSSYDGVFFTAVKTTGIFCRPTCPARRPKRQNIRFYHSAREALGAGFRPCKRCHPLEARGKAPQWIASLIEEVERHPARRWKDADLRALRLQPERVRRWFQANHGMTFHQYQRARRLGIALGQIQQGDGPSRAGLDVGFESESGFRDAFKRLFGNTPGKAHEGSIVVNRITTPLGPMLAGATSEGLCLLEFTDRRMLETQLRRLQHHLQSPAHPGSNEHLERAAAEVEGYFAGRLRDFTVPLVAPGTQFQMMVWEELGRIPYGSTESYDSIAKRIGRPGARRAVGKANGDNRIAIVIPCHRVVRSDGTLSGYGGGVWRKKKLLELEAGETGITF